MASHSAMERMERTLAALKTAFDSVDKDKKGRIGKTQLQGLIQKVGLDPTDDTIKRALDGMKVDKSGDVCFLEFSKAYMDIEAKKREDTMVKLRKMFDAYDRNRDGYICKEDLWAVSKPGTPEKEINEMLSKLDRKNKGKIDFQDFVAGMSTK